MEEEALLNEEDVLPLVHIQQTSEGLQIGSDLPTYPPILDDWYHGPSNQVKVQQLDWKKVTISFPGEKPKEIKMGSQLTEDEIDNYKALIREFPDVFVWSYLELKGVPPKFCQFTIPLFPGTHSICMKQQRMNPKLLLIVRAELEQLLEAQFIRPIEIIDWVSPMVLVKKNLSLH